MDAGLVGICWTNTLLIAVPREGAHVVTDVAFSQFSYGALAAHRMRGEMPPVDGGDAGGLSIHQIAADPKREIGMCQMFLVRNTAAFSDAVKIAVAVIESLGNKVETLAARV